MAQSAMIDTSARGSRTEYIVPPLRVDEDAKIDESRRRRFSVSAESSNPSSSSTGSFTPKIIPKTREAITRIRRCLADLFIWKDLSDDEQRLLIDSMIEIKPEINSYPIKQGDKGDFFYVIESGTFEVWKSSSMSHHSRARTDSAFEARANRVFVYRNEGAFGELALMYNAPRAASIKCVSVSSILWAVDGETFRHIITNSTHKKRQSYEEFLLNSVSLLSNVPDSLRSQIADIVQLYTYKKGDLIIEQGDSVHINLFYIIFKGEVQVYLGGKGSSKKILRTLKSGDYFGERSLLFSTRRSANVVVTSPDECHVLAIDKASFVRLMESTSVYQRLRRRLRYYTVEEDFSERRGSLNGHTSPSYSNGSNGIGSGSGGGSRRRSIRTGSERVGSVTSVTSAGSSGDSLSGLDQSQDSDGHPKAPIHHPNGNGHSFGGRRRKGGSSPAGTGRVVFDDDPDEI